jgi:MFS family permease
MSPAVSPGWTAGVQSQFLTKSNVEQSMDDDQGRASFMASFRNSNGAPQVVILCLLIALSLGSTIGVVPAVMTDRFARLNYGFDDEHDCSFFTPEKGSVPKECTSGSNDAQNAMAMSQLVMNLITFLTSSVVGSMSDVRGRRSLLLAAIFLSLGGPFLLVVLQLLPHMSPYWYYAAVAGGGIINFLAIALSVLGDVMPVKFRAPCFGLLLA